MYDYIEIIAFWGESNKVYGCKQRYFKSNRCITHERTRYVRVGTGTTPTENEFEFKEKQRNTQRLLFFVAHKNR